MEITSGVIVEITEQSQVAEARRRAVAAGASLGFDEPARGRLALVATEAATNLLKHAGRGDFFIGPAGTGRTRGVQLLALDKGPGIRNVAESLRDGFSTAGSPGTGLGAIRRMASSFDVYSVPAAGTVVAATVYADGTPPPLLGAIAVPAPREFQCGDGWAAWSAGELTSILVSDGLGHGEGAALATRRATAAFHRHAEQAAIEVVTKVSDALASTRGAAVAVAALDQRNGRLTFCGVGNLSGVIIRPDGSTQHMISHNGIAGHTARRLQEFTYAWPAGSLAIIHSDGVATSWSLEKYSGLVARRPDVIAGVLFRDCRRERDDSTVVVARNGAAG